MSTTKKLMKMLILTATMICFGLLFANIANAEETECKHVVYCDDFSVCILCGKEDLDEEDITEIKHQYAYCYAPTECGVCRRPFEEGEVYEIRHNTDYNVTYVPAGRGHRTVCWCGAEMGKDIDRHFVYCTQEDKSKCAFCKADVGEDVVCVHTNEQVRCNRENHWLVCLDCEQQTSPLLDHYTLCTDLEDAPCDFCGMAHDECIFKEEFIGLHLDIDQIIEEDGEFYHIAPCTECGKEITRHKGLIYEDFGDNETHEVYCRECGHQFDDEMHGEMTIIDKFDATCTTDGYTGDLVCEDCGHKFEEGTVIKALGHEYKNGVCIRCGQKETPLTGDENNIIIWIAIMALASVCIFGFIRKFRKI